ncbi:MAG: sterol desaturase family protein [Deltaproteobacteria bacterium]|nr:sterol desaturase family protein [Deltaproteobacteria bacterium]
MLAEDRARKGAKLELPRDGRAILDARAKARQRLHDSIPAGYRPWMHLAGTVGVGVVGLGLAVWGVRAPRASELLAVPATFLLANLFEWRVHRGVLHHRQKLLEPLYDRHTPEHHMVFGYDDMAIRSPKELKLVLIPALGVAGIVATTTPLAYGLSKLFGANVGWLFLATAAVYAVGYELSHLSYHLPEDSFVGRLSLVRVLREQHRRHHHPRLMQRWNFNVTLPIGDWLHRTQVPGDVLEQTLAQDRITRRTA